MYVIKRDNTKSGLTAVTFIGAGQAVMSVAAVILAVTAPGKRDALPRVTAELVGRAVWHYSWQRENLLVSSASINFMTKPEQNKRHTATLSGLKKDWLGYKKSLQKCLIRSVYYLADAQIPLSLSSLPPYPYRSRLLFPINNKQTREENDCNVIPSSAYVHRLQSASNGAMRHKFALWNNLILNPWKLLLTVFVFIKQNAY